MATTKSRTRRATSSVVNGATSVVAILPGLTAKALKIVEAAIGVLNKAITAVNKAVAVVRIKLEELESFLSDYYAS